MRNHNSVSCYRTRPNPIAPLTRTDEMEYEAECLVDKRISKSGRHVHYLVKWKGFAPHESTWEPPANLANCKELIADYERAHPDERTPSRAKSAKKGKLPAAKKLAPPKVEMGEPSETKKATRGKKMMEKGEPCEANKATRGKKMGETSEVKKTTRGKKVVEKGEPSEAKMTTRSKKVKAAVEIDGMKDKAAQGDGRKVLQKTDVNPEQKKEEDRLKRAHRMEMFVADLKKRRMQENTPPSTSIGDEM